MTSEVITLLAALTHRGVQLAAASDRLRYRPAEAVTEELRADLIRHKRDLLILVCHMSVPPLPAGTWGQCASALLARVEDDQQRADLREAFEERAAICQHLGNLNADDAERIAFLQLCKAIVTGRSGSPEPLQPGSPAAADSGLTSDSTAGMPEGPP